MKKTLLRSIEFIYYSFEELMIYSGRKFKYGKATPSVHLSINISPRDIKYRIEGLDIRSKARTQIISGSWDILETDQDNEWGDQTNKPKKVKFINFPFYQIVEKEYKNADIADIDFEHVSKKYNTHDAESLEYYYNLFNNIKSNGYKCASELGNIFPFPQCHEINVAIGRNGNIYKIGGGNHRLAIAKALDLDRVPVYIRVRHPKWQKIRKNAVQFPAENSNKDEVVKYMSHPDITYLLD